MTAQKKYFPGVDVIKFLMALCVIIIHVGPVFNPSVQYPEALSWLIRIAVPFFFIVSGFFLGRNTSEINEIAIGQKTVVKRSIHFFRIFLYWMAIYLPITLYLYISEGATPLHCLKNYITGALVLGEERFAWQLWFIYSLAIVCGIYGLLYKLKNVRIILFILFTLALVHNELYEAGQIENNFISKLFYASTFRTLGGGAYVFAGIFLATHHHRLSAFISLIIISLSILLFYFSIPLWELIGGIGFFGLSLKISIFQKSVASVFRSMSMWIYFIHMYILFFIKKLLDSWSLEVNLYVLMAVCIIISILVGGAITILQKSPRFSFLKKLIS